MEKGFIQVYTGDGKGKTTAALGLSLRCLCAGNKVFIGQFMKGQDYSELMAPSLFEGLSMEQYGDPHFVHGEPDEDDCRNAKRGLDRMKEFLVSGQYDLVVFDEINTSLFYHLVEVEDMMAILDLKPEKTEVLLTGRYAPQEIIDRADLVTEMLEIRHYYNAGVPARVGIEK